MKKLWYRFRQFILSRVLHLVQHKTAQRFVGNGALMGLPELLVKEQLDSVMVVTTAGFIKRKTLEGLLGQMEKGGIKVTVFSEVTPDPTIECVEKGVKLYKDNKCKAIIAVGGGSVMDCSKAIGARAVCPNKSIRQMKGLLKIGRKIPPLYAVPTTAGTGSEVTAAAVVTDTVNGTHYKYAINDLHLIPKVAILDASLTVGLSPEMTACTGMDALTHAVEAYTNKFASRYVKTMASDAVKMIFENLPAAYADGKNTAARENMLIASCYAGIAFTNNFVGYVHAIAHGIGGLYGVPHGKANAVLLPVVLREFGSSVYKPLSQLADAAGIKGESMKEKAEGFISQIEKMKHNMNLPEGFKELRASDYDELIGRAIREGNPTYPVPDIWNEANFRNVLKQVTIENNIKQP